MKTLFWATTILLVLVGVAAALGRSFFIGDLTSRVEPVRERMLRSIGRDERLVQRDPEQIRRFDRSFRAHPFVTYLHIVPGAMFLLLAPLQLLVRFRTRHLRFHRRLGRVLMILVLMSATASLLFGLFLPYGGWSESLLIAMVGTLLFVSVTRGFLAVRRGDIARHREWMLRTFAICVGISTARVIAAALDFGVTALSPRAGFIVAIWSGWILTLAVTEGWIRATGDTTVAGFVT